MALVLADRVRETTTVVGTGTATLLGAVTGYQSFTAVGNANTTYYVIASQAANEWEVGIGTYTASGTTLSRDTVLSSSNSNSLVNFTAGTKDIWVDYAAGKAVTTDTLAYPPVIGNTTPNAATFTTLTATGQTSLGGVEGSESLRVTPAASAVNYVEIFGASAADGRPLIRAAGASAAVELRLSSKSTSNISFWTNNAQNRQFQVSHTASAVNFVQVTGAATGSAPVVAAQGSDANVVMRVASKGTQVIAFSTNYAGSGTGNTQVLISHTANAVNFWQLTGSATGVAPVLSAQGSDTNISQVFQSKGTGAIDLAAGSSGVNISNGGTVTAITRTAAGSGYTSVPSVAISAPTTAGGVQATATASGLALVGATAVVSGGTGYTVGDTLTLAGFTGTAPTFTVTTVSSGVVTAVTAVSGGNFTAAPSSPASVTGGTGSGATISFTSGVLSTFTITNAGSGYVEQPTVTFSGGGGSGAAAYATVGAGSIIRSLGLTGTQSLSFFTPSGEAVRIRDTGSVGAYSMFTNSASGTTLVTQGTANAFASFNSNGTGSVLFGTNGNSGNNQMVVSHTASAVNYVQVTGAATGASPIISAQGSDANVTLALTSKGTSNINFFTAGAGSRSLQVRHATGTLVNYPFVTGSVTGAGPVYSVDGTDTNIDLALTPKGTGNVRFGTRTASADAAITGYIEIKDSGGTIRRLAVIG